MFEDYQAKVTQASKEVLELEQLALMKEHNELLRESQQEKEAKKAVAFALTKTRCKWINEDSEDLSEKVNKVNI